MKRVAQIAFILSAVWTFISSGCASPPMDTVALTDVEYEVKLDYGFGKEPSFRIAPDSEMVTLLVPRASRFGKYAEGRSISEDRAGTMTGKSEKAKSDVEDAKSAVTAADIASLTSQDEAASDMMSKDAEGKADFSEAKAQELDAHAGAGLGTQDARAGEVGEEARSYTKTDSADSRRYSESAGTSETSSSEQTIVQQDSAHSHERIFDESAYIHSEGRGGEEKNKAHESDTYHQSADSALLLSMGKGKAGWSATKPSITNWIKKDEVLIGERCTYFVEVHNRCPLPLISGEISIPLKKGLFFITDDIKVYPRQSPVFSESENFLKIRLKDEILPGETLRLEIPTVIERYFAEQYLSN